MYVHLYSLHGSNCAASELEFASLPLSREENGMRIGWCVKVMRPQTGGKVG